MMDAEIIERVEGWIAAFAQTTARPDTEIVAAIVAQLRGASRRWGPRSGAACGALLALVSEYHGRECWLEPRSRSTEPDSYGAITSWGVHGLGYDYILAVGPSKIEALLVALETSPDDPRLRRAIR